MIGDESFQAATATATAPSQADAPAEPARAPETALPALTTTLTPDVVLDRLGKASRRGRLPGFEVIDPAGTAEPPAFKIAAFGQPFDRIVVGRIGGAGPSGVRAISFESKLLLKAPLVLAASLVLSVWPGLPLVDAMIPARWGWWDTWTWYIPLCLLPLPFLPRLWKKSETAARAEAHKAVAKVAQELGLAPPGVGGAG